MHLTSSGRENCKVKRNLIDKLKANNSKAEAYLSCINSLSFFIISLESEIAYSDEGVKNQGVEHLKWEIKIMTI